MSNNILLLLLALVAGAMMPTQAATNNKMSLVTGSPILAAFLSFAVGTVALFVCVIAAGTPATSYAAIKEAPPIGMDRRAARSIFRHIGSSASAAHRRCDDIQCNDRRADAFNANNRPFRTARR
ncbi:MAG: DMT family transporter [Pyrinomonadaceae bacterium]